MKGKLFLILGVVMIGTAIIGGKFTIHDRTLLNPLAPKEKHSLWNIRSIDTMKYSRDTSRAKLNDPTFDVVIDQQVQNIAKTGATHVAIATPYDEEFVPFLTRWVAAARKYHLHVWFRGNWSGWEGWFGYSPMTRQEHLDKTKAFILAHKDLFEEGDIFTACPECENGGPGDPRQTGDVAGYREFLIKEYQVTSEAFKKIGKNVTTNYDSMNADVARLVMDKQTTQALGGVVVIDHYVSSPMKLASDIESISQTSGGKIVLGEFGAPIPDLNGTMTEEEQAVWIDDVFSLLSKSSYVLGMNYWVSVGGSTQLWDDSGKARQAVGVVSKWYSKKI